MKQIESILKALTVGVAAWVLVLCGSHVGAKQFASPLHVKVTPNTQRLMPYQVFELTFQHEGKYADPTWDVTIDVTFTSPSGKRVLVGGFFYGSSKPQKPVIKEWKDDRGRTRTSATWTCDPADLWKARYAPSELGAWKFDYVFMVRSPALRRNYKQGESARGSGTFRVVKGRVQSSGWVRIHPNNPFRFVFEDGSPYYPIGFQDGVFDNNHNGSAMDAMAMEGPFRLDNADQRPKPPPGALFARGPSMNPVNGDVHFGRHARAGFNMWRFSPHNFSLDVFSLDSVNWAEARMVDEMLQLTRRYDIRNFYGIFGFMKVFNDAPKNVEGMAKVKRLIKYTVDRWGAYVDVWELLNEQKASDEWYAVVIPTLKSIDPYQKPIATSWERPELQGIDISAPHWYGREDELASDQVTANHAAAQKKFGKPVVYGEQGNGGGKPELVPLGIGGVWDPGSARRMRVRLWTAFFHEISLVFWETSYAKDGHHMNIWLGPEERQYVHALQDFAHRLDPGVQTVKVHLAGRLANEVRGYGLRSDKSGTARRPFPTAVYLHHSGCAECAKLASSGERRPHHWDHDRGEVRDLQVTLDVPQAAKGYWYSPTDANILGRFDARAGQQTFTAPPFKIDLALLITEAGAPDIDRDGKPNDQDEDDDGDSFPDARDAFPLEREEWADADADRIGDNLDADIDADGVADDCNNNGKPDNEEDDWDGDGVKNASVIPWDAFPRDPKEWRDSDGDGMGDNADLDDDGDGYSDKEEKQASTDPLDPVRFPEEKAQRSGQGDGAPASVVVSLPQTRTVSVQVALTPPPLPQCGRGGGVRAERHHRQR